MNVNHVCKKCRFWSTEATDDDESGTRGECHRYPPLHVIATLVMVEDESTRNDSNLGVGIWPCTYHDNWCGEFRVES